MRTLDLSDPRILDQSLVVSASAGSGKTFTLTVLVTARLGRGDIRPWEILATTFSETSAADLRERLLRPLDLLSALDEAAWQHLLPHLETPVAKDLEGILKDLPTIQHLKKSAGEVAQAAAHWLGAPWIASPTKARAFWRRVRREAELLQVSTIHSLAMRVLTKGEGSNDTILDVRHPSLLRLLRLTVRESLTLPSGHADEVPARLLLAWAEQNWEALSQGFDNHLDALGHLKGEDPSHHRDALTHALAAGPDGPGALRGECGAGQASQRQGPPQLQEGEPPPGPRRRRRSADEPPLGPGPERARVESAPGLLLRRLL